MLQSYARKLLLAALTVVLVASLGNLVFADQAVLMVDDCVKCHSKEPAQIAADGASHQSAINCKDCHESHRPMVANNIPLCSNCHEGSSHYEVKERCIDCHNPHEPLNIHLTGEQKSVCVTCHAGPEKQMQANPSKHATFACSFCHADTHGNIPLCIDCHSPHTESMTQKDCATCHQAHQPLVLNFQESTSSQLCASCHDSVMEMLSTSKTKHNQISCVTCHAGKHKTIPQCSDCHGLPHAQAMHDRFPKCGDCHNVAHDLNNWPNKSAKK